MSDGQYENRHQFKEDLDLIVANCKAYNGEGSPVFEAAVEFEKVFTGRKQIPTYFSPSCFRDADLHTLHVKEWARVEKTLSKKAQTGPESLPAPPTALKFNIKRPSIPSVDLTANGTVAGDASRPSLSIRTKDYAPPVIADKPKSAMKPGAKRQQKPQTGEVNYDILDALATSPPPAAKQKKVKIVNSSKPPPVLPPKPKVNDGGPLPTVTISKPVITLKRKLEPDTERYERRPSPMAPAETVTPAVIPNLTAAPTPVNAQRLTEKGWTQDRTPFKRVRALRLLRDLVDRYRLLVSHDVIATRTAYTEPNYDCQFYPKPDEMIAPKSVSVSF